MSVDEDRPVVTGLFALVGVGLAVGLIAGLAVMVGVHVIGVGGGSTGGGSGAGPTMYLPKPQKTAPSSGPSLTLGTSSTTTASPSQQASSKPAKPKKRISLQAGEQTVAPMGRIDLTGTYPSGEGAVLNVQEFTNGSWQDFYSVSATVQNGTFSTYIQTGIAGLARFRVIDSDTHLASNEVRVTVR